MEPAELPRDTGPTSITELIGADRIEVEARGAGIESVTLKIRRLSPEVSRVVIPAGTFFPSPDGAVQSMVCVQHTSVRLDSNAPMSVSVRVACANRLRAIPDADASLAVARTASSDDLERLAVVLDNVDPPFPVVQAAVWIVTDDADYTDLGILESRRSTPATIQLTGTRTIRHTDAARAMQLCSQAGVDIKQRAVWGDLLFILDKCEDNGVAEWFAREFAWDLAIQHRTEESLTRFLTENPEHERASEATEILRELPWEFVVHEGSEEALRGFVADYPQHARAAGAAAALSDLDGGTLSERTTEGKVSTSASIGGLLGQAITLDRISLTIRRKTSFPLVVTIPAGTLFVDPSFGSESYEMISIEPVTVRLDAESTEVWVPAATLTLLQGIPRPSARELRFHEREFNGQKISLYRDFNHRGRSFSVAQLGSDLELETLLQLIAVDGSFQFATRQAAVWIAARNASYRSFRVLNNDGLWYIGPLSESAEPLIGPEEAAAAMRLCEQAGIDVKSKVIWTDREEILRNLQDETLREWLQSRKEQ